jgi:hypothetical protein
MRQGSEFDFGWNSGGEHFTGSSVADLIRDLTIAVLIHIWDSFLELKLLARSMAIRFFVTTHNGFTSVIDNNVSVFPFNMDS